ncbi:hypothetical protein GGR55DRAFT_407994 [Xylaria sp. FL0064]|nr:hypothetical protein GGR55DRAFT_407994 [Xylaria sp. FL0064]
MTMLSFVVIAVVVLNSKLKLSAALGISLCTLSLHFAKKFICGRQADGRLISHQPGRINEKTPATRLVCAHRCGDSNIALYCSGQLLPYCGVTLRKSKTAEDRRHACRFSR